MLKLPKRANRYGRTDGVMDGLALIIETLRFYQGTLLQVKHLYNQVLKKYVCP